jgi:polyisoprenoid-binding protein YceI
MSETIIGLPTPTAATYKIDADRSQIRFVTRHMFGLGKVKGSFALSAGEIAVKDPLPGSSVNVAANAASFATRNPIRDAHVRSRMFLDARRYPQLVFRSTSLTQVDGRWRLTGRLSVKGVEAPLELTVTKAHVAGDRITFTATGTVDRYDHGVRAFPGMAARRLDITVSVAADASSTA